ncbi:MAG: hypothetical protein ACYC3X_21960 [Pirellulaceae bacterium]
MIPETLTPIRDRLQLDAGRWADVLQQTLDLLRSATGRWECVTREAGRMGRQ